MLRSPSTFPHLASSDDAWRARIYLLSSVGLMSICLGYTIRGRGLKWTGSLISFSSPVSQVKRTVLLVTTQQIAYVVFLVFFFIKSGPVRVISRTTHGVLTLKLTCCCFNAALANLPMIMNHCPSAIGPLRPTCSMSTASPFPRSCLVK